MKGASRPSWEERDAVRAVAALNALGNPYAAANIGAVGARGNARVTLESLIGVNHVLDMLSGEQLPRIC